MKKCQYCNAPITKGTYCNEQCRNKYYCSLKVDNTRIFPGRKQLDNIAMEAKKKHMTYGQYRAEQLQMVFAEITETIGNLEEERQEKMTAFLKTILKSFLESLEV